MLLLLALLVITTYCSTGAVSVILQKSLFIQQGAHSILNISNNIGQLSDNVMSGQLNLYIQRKNRYTSMRFDTFFFDQNNQQYEQIMACYKKNRYEVQKSYSEYKACNYTKCNQEMWSGFQGNMSQLVNSTGINNKNNAFPSRTFIIENSLFPCQNGTFFPQVELLETIEVTLTPGYIFYDILKISLLIVIELLVVFGTANYVLYSKLKSLKKKLSKIKDKSKVTDLFEELDIMRKNMVSSSVGIKSKQTAVEMREQMENRARRINSEMRQQQVTEFVMKSESREF